MERGVLSADGSTITTPLTHATLAGDRQWADLDRRGNWLDTRWTVAPTGTPELRQQVRTANGANEYTSIDPTHSPDDPTHHPSRCSIGLSLCHSAHCDF